MTTLDRRELLRRLAASAAALPFAAHGFLPSLGLAGEAAAQATGAAPLAGGAPRRQRLVVIFSPNGTIPDRFWPDEAGKISKFKPILEPLEPFRDKTLLLRGVANRVRGDGDNHMRGMSCLLTGTELFPGNIQGGSDTPAGWSKGISIDQELKGFLQSRPETRTRFGSLEFGVAVPHRADPWTRMSYAGPNQPVAPIHDPYQMFEKMYGRTEDRETLKGVLESLQAELQQVAPQVSAEHRPLLEQHLTLVRQTQEELSRDGRQDGAAPPHAMPPQLEPGVGEDNDNIPKHSRMNIDLLVNALSNDFTRVATLQYTNSVSNARMKWLGIEEGHHTLSHEPDNNQAAVDGLTKINHWYCGEVAYLLKRLAETSEPNGGTGTMLDNTLVVWTNELGKGNSHTLDGIPLVLAGGGCDFRLGEAVSFDNVPLNRLWLSVAHAFGHEIDVFGTAQLCEGGPLRLA